MAFATNNISPKKYSGYSYLGKKIVLAQQRGNHQQGRKRYKMSYHDEDKKIEVATLFAVTKNVKETANLAKVSEAVIRRWRDEPWFTNVMERVVKDRNDVLDAKLTQALDKAGDAILDRLENGDVKVNYNTGKVFRAGMDARALAVLTGVIFDKRQLLRGEATSRTESVSFERKLQELKDTFTNLSKVQEIQGEYTRIKDDDSIQEKTWQDRIEAREKEILKEEAEKKDANRDGESPEEISKKEENVQGTL